MIDITSLPILERTTEAKVLDLHSGNAPKLVQVQFTGGDGAKIDVWWTGSPAIAVNDYVRIRRTNINTVRYVVDGTARGTADRSKWPFSQIVTVDTIPGRADYTTVQNGIDNAAGKQVWAGDGVYAEDVVFNSAGIVLKGTSTVDYQLTEILAATAIAGDVGASGDCAIERIKFHNDKIAGTNIAFRVQASGYAELFFSQAVSDGASGTQIGAQFSGSGELNYCLLDAPDYGIEVTSGGVVFVREGTIVNIMVRTGGSLTLVGTRVSGTITVEAGGELVNVKPLYLGTTSFAVGAIVVGEWQDSSGVTRYPQTPTPTGSDVPIWNNTSNEWIPGSVVGIPITGPQINGAGSVTSPADADKFGFYEVSNSILKYITWANIKATLKTYFDALYAALGSLDAVKVSKLVASDGSPDPALSADATGQITAVDNVILSGASKAIKGTGSNFPDVGTSTLAEKAGNIYLGTGKTIYAADDAYDIWNRLVNWGCTPDEHWHQNSDDIAWTGWAAYTGFATPSVISTTNSIYRVANAGATKAFRYRAAATGANIYLRCRVGITYLCSAGLMIDDGVDKTDNEGANNFYRVYLTQASVGGDLQVVEQYRTGGLTVTTTTAAFTFNPIGFIGLRLQASGTRWTNWNGFAAVFGESGAASAYTSASSALSWTPARVGLYWVGTAVDGGRQGLWDWYDEATS